MAFPFMRSFQDAGGKLILFTMRGGEFLKEAVNFCSSQGIKFYGVNDNPSQASWTSSRKVYANLYIDDAAVGCPLTLHMPTCNRPYVNWLIVGPMVMRILEDRYGKKS